MLRCLWILAAVAILAAGSAQAQNNRPLLSIKPKEQKELEEEALNIKPRPTMKAKNTIVERSSGQRLIVSTDDSGTKVTEQGSGRMIWSSNRDAHDLKVGEYTAGGMGKVVTPGQVKRPE